MWCVFSDGTSVERESIWHIVSFELFRKLYFSMIDLMEFPSVSRDIDFATRFARMPTTGSLHTRWINPGWRWGWKSRKREKSHSVAFIELIYHLDDYWKSTNSYVTLAMPVARGKIASRQKAKRKREATD